MLKKQTDSRNKRLKAEFLPTALEIIEKPTSPLGNSTIWIIFAIVTIAIIWSIIGKVDTVAVARGKVIPDGNIKVLQSADTAIITAINVIEGQSVNKGQVLIELDDTMSRADFENISGRLETATIEKELLVAQQENEDISQKLDEFKSKGYVIDEVFIESLMRYNRVKSINYDENQKANRLEVDKINQEIYSAESELLKIEKEIKIYQGEVDKLKILSEQGAVASNEYTLKKGQLELLRQSLVTQQKQVDSLNEQKQIATQRVDIFASGIDTELHKEIISKDKEILALKAELDKAQKALDMKKLVSPVDGLVQGIGNNTLGGVVTPAQPIMSIVPEDTPLVLEAFVLNRDIGFIEMGQEVEVKLDTFSFQKYGSLKGEILNIGADAVEREGMGYVYKILVAFHDTSLEVGNRVVSISPGLTATAEIKLEKRRIIEFFIPAIDYVKESVKLR